MSTTYCQGPTNAPINAYVCSTTPPGPPVYHSHTIVPEITGIIIVFVLACLIAFIIALCYYSTQHKDLNYKSRRQLRFERDGRLFAHELKMAEQRTLQTQAATATVAAYLPSDTIEDNPLGPTPNPAYAAMVAEYDRHKNAMVAKKPATSPISNTAIAAIRVISHPVKCVCDICHTLSAEPIRTVEILRAEGQANLATELDKHFGRRRMQNKTKTSSAGPGGLPMFETATETCVDHKTNCGCTGCYLLNRYRNGTPELRAQIDAARGRSSSNDALLLAARSVQDNLRMDHINGQHSRYMHDCVICHPLYQGR